MIFSTDIGITEFIKMIRILRFWFFFTCLRHTVLRCPQIGIVSPTRVRAVKGFCIVFIPHHLQNLKQNPGTNYMHSFHPYI